MLSTTPQANSDGHLYFQHGGAHWRRQRALRRRVAREVTPRQRCGDCGAAATSRVNDMPYKGIPGMMSDSSVWSRLTQPCGCPAPVSAHFALKSTVQGIASIGEFSSAPNPAITLSNSPG